MQRKTTDGIISFPSINGKIYRNPPQRRQMAVQIRPFPPDKHASAEASLMKEVEKIKICAPIRGTCRMCATKHDPALPHDRNSLYYQMRFYQVHKRLPTWNDAMSHCSGVVRMRRWLARAVGSRQHSGSTWNRWTEMVGLKLVIICPDKRTVRMDMSSYGTLFSGL